MAKKKAAKKKAAKKKAAKRKQPSALTRAEARVTGLKYAVQAAELVQRARADLRAAPPSCRNALKRAQDALQRAIRACD